MDKVMLIDGNSIINRAFYALPVLSSKDGEYTNAVLGFLNIFFKLYDEEQPDFVVVAFDLPKPTFRHEKFAAYKGTRKSMPEELRPQIPLLKNLLKLMNINVVEAEGYEADDILGTLAKKAEQRDALAVVISGDRDLLQIASDKTKIRIPKTKGGKTEVEDYFAADVFKKFGVTPEEYIDVKALMGDASDNIPGVPGIGEKTALSIIKEYKNVEAAIENAQTIKPKRASENLSEFCEQALLSKMLAKIETDVPISINFVKTMDMFNENAAAEFKRLGLKSYYSRFGYTQRQPEAKPDTNPAHLIETEIGARELFGAVASKTVAYKLFHNGCALDGISFCFEACADTLIKTSDELNEQQLLHLCKDFFEGESGKITLDAKKDMHFLHRHGVEMNNLCFDIMMGAYVLNEDYTDVENECNCAGRIFSTYIRMDAKIRENAQEELYYRIELPLIHILADMEITGVKIDENELYAYGEMLRGRIDALTAQIYELAGEEFNINSPKQMSVILFEKLGLKGGKKTKTGWSTSADILEKLSGKHEIIGLILEYRENAKLKSTYVDGLLAVMDKKTKRLHSTFNQALTATGRISSTEPNLQNIPVRTALGREIRKVFVPRDENYLFIDADYSQIELRILAHMSQDGTFINAFREGQDIHKITASQVFNVPFDEVTPRQRSYAKAVNFGIVYGISAYSLSDDINVSVKEAAEYIDGYFAKYARVKQYLDEAVNNAKETGYASTIFNRRRSIPEIHSANYNTRSFGERVAMNMPVQGSAADIIKIAMVKVAARLANDHLRSKLILQVHDELLIEAHIDEVEAVKRILADEMQNAVELSVPLDIDINVGRNWLEAK